MRNEDQREQAGLFDAGAQGAQTRDIGADNGRRPPFATSIDEGLGSVGRGRGYSGQEYDAAGQEQWRAEQQRQKLPADGDVQGSGAGAGGQNPGEDFDISTPVDTGPALVRKAPIVRETSND